MAHMSSRYNGIPTAHMPIPETGETYWVREGRDTYQDFSLEDIPRDCAACGKESFSSWEAYGSVAGRLWYLQAGWAHHHRRHSHHRRPHGRWPQGRELPWWRLYLQKTKAIEKYRRCCYLYSLTIWVYVPPSLSNNRSYSLPTHPVWNMWTPVHRTPCAYARMREL